MLVNYNRDENLLVTSVLEYLDLFGSKNNFTTQNAVTAFLYHYKDIRMNEFYLNIYRDEDFILSYDSFDICLSTEAYNYLHILLSRRFKFDNSDETIQLRFSLYFEDIADFSHYSNSIKFSRENDHEEDYDLSEITNDKFYKLVEKSKPTKYEIYVYPDV
jgi:hypothetical protein